MKHIKETSIKGQHFINGYYNSGIYSVTSAYKTSPSSSKIQAEYSCKQVMNNEGGWSYRIISANTFHFTCGWQVDFEEVRKDGQKILHKRALRVETATSSYIIY